MRHTGFVDSREVADHTVVLGRRGFRLFLQRQNLIERPTGRVPNQRFWEENMKRRWRTPWSRSRSEISNWRYKKYRERGAFIAASNDLFSASKDVMVEDLGARSRERKPAARSEANGTP
jgi:hypothetical protein